MNEREAMTLNKLRDSMAFALYALDTQGDARKFAIKVITEWKVGLDAYLSRAAEPVGLIVRDLCEMDRPDIDAPDTIVVSTDDLIRVLRRYTRPPEPARDALSRLLVPGLRVYAGDYVVQIDAGKLGLFTERFADEKDKPRALQVVRQRAIDAAMQANPDAKEGDHE